MIRLHINLYIYDRAGRRGDLVLGSWDRGSEWASDISNRIFESK